ncbi:lytic transglycosylase domain-containing protein [Thermonema rossianum]|uniref:lytic transglycosylase domain-containing protein n=1 Tax=Thermonema rossianum TaxID=55505 RepID=UPI00068EBBBA|nr:lytic transglycosylase domain-containing protein [Thermonema rossianum]
MRNLQLLVLLGVILLLVFYSIYERLQDPVRSDYEQDYAYQLYLANKEVPQQIYFLDEEVPLYDAQVRERFAYEIYILTKWRSYTIELLSKAKYWLPIFEKILRSYELPADFKYLVVIESGMRNVVSPAGAAGFWQLLPETARMMGLRVDHEVDERYHPVKAAHAAARYLRLAYKEIGSWTYVAASYNAGIGAMRYAVATQQAPSYYYMVLNPETNRYVMKAAAFKEVYEHPLKYGFDLPIRAWQPPAYRTIQVRTSIPSLKKFAQMQGTSLKTLRALNPWLVGESLTLPEGKTYEIRLPVQADYEATLEDEEKTTPPPVDSLGVPADSPTVQDRVNHIAADRE